MQMEFISHSTHNIKGGIPGSPHQMYLVLRQYRLVVQKINKIHDKDDDVSG